MDPAKDHPSSLVFVQALFAVVGPGSLGEYFEQALECVEQAFWSTGSRGSESSSNLGMSEIFSLFSLLNIDVWGESCRIFLGNVVLLIPIFGVGGYVCGVLIFGTVTGVTVGKFLDLIC